MPACPPEVGKRLKFEVLAERALSKPGDELRIMGHQVRAAGREGEGETERRDKLV